MRVLSVGWTTLTGTLWAHYYRGLAPVRTVAIGRITGDCGNVVKRATQFPFSGPKTGSWKVFFSNTRVLDKQHDAWFFYKLTVRSAAASRMTARGASRPVHRRKLSAPCATRNSRPSTTRDPRRRASRSSNVPPGR
jgi:hypothetical protein